MRASFRLSIVASLIAAAACGGAADKGADSSAAAPAPAAAAGGEVKPAAGGKVIEIIMTTDDKGSYFSPSEVEAKQGDVLHFKLVTGVHNVNFLADSNPGKTGLPAASTFLQLPGQTYDVAVSFAEGTYYWQCDPHAALGMKGHVKVTK